ncbi:MAG TPA: XDD4 family exosortase-dependent surface protein [Gemmataceae bacterium]|nr:XDD4 family exosortase-dependent surface protein [Gemmataceae bacterium]
MSLMRWRVLAALALLSGVFTLDANAGITFTGSSGNLSASATFEVVGNNLQITLTNTSTFETNVPADVLTAIFFDIAGNPTLGNGVGASVVLAGGANVINGSQPAGGIVGGEFAFQQDSGGLGGGLTQHYGVSSVGLNLFGPGDLFPGDNLAGPDSPDGLQYGLVSQGAIVPQGNNNPIATDPLIQSSVVITLTGAGSNFNLNSISNIRFQYGTALNEPSFPPRDQLLEAPAPPALVLALTGLACFGGLGFRRRLRALAAPV